MQESILSELNQARSNRQAVVLVTNLGMGQQKLLVGDSAPGTDPRPDPLRDHARQVLETNTCLRVRLDEQDLFIQPFNPPLRMLIIGAVHITQYLADFSRLCGFEVFVIDPRRAFASRDRFPDSELIDAWPDQAMTRLPPDARTAVVTLSHDPKLDDPALCRALNSPAFYVGALGSRKTARARNQRLLESGFSAAQIVRIHGPAGLDIGAESPAEIAVSILAEAINRLHKPEHE